MFFALLIKSFITTTISPNFYTITILEIIFPITFIFSSINMNINAITMCFIITPFSFIYILFYITCITINMPKFTFTTSSILFPFSIKFSSILIKFELKKIPAQIMIPIPSLIFPHHSPSYIPPVENLYGVLRSLFKVLP